MDYKHAGLYMPHIPDSVPTQEFFDRFGNPAAEEDEE
jgi:hypothetical protein